MVVKKNYRRPSRFRIGEFSCMPPHNEEEKTLGSAPIINNWYKTSVNYFWPMGIYVCVRQFSEALTSGFIHVITSLCRDLFVLYGARCSCLWCLVALAALKYNYVAICCNFNNICTANISYHASRLQQLSNCTSPVV